MYDVMRSRMVAFVFTLCPQGRPTLVTSVWFSNKLAIFLEQIYV